jgi:hypothetical protein
MSLPLPTRPGSCFLAVRRTFTPGTRVVGELRVMHEPPPPAEVVEAARGHILPGDLALHLESGHVLSQELHRKDVLWLREPILDYQRYGTLDRQRRPGRGSDGGAAAASPALEMRV